MQSYNLPAGGLLLLLHMHLKTIKTVITLYPILCSTPRCSSSVSPRGQVKAGAPSKGGPGQGILPLSPHPRPEPGQPLGLRSRCLRAGGKTEPHNQFGWKRPLRSSNPIYDRAPPCTESSTPPLTPTRTPGLPLTPAPVLPPGPPPLPPPPRPVSRTAPHSPRRWHRPFARPAPAVAALAPCDRCLLLLLLPFLLLFLLLRRHDGRGWGSGRTWRALRVEPRGCGGGSCVPFAEL